MENIGIFTFARGFFADDKRLFTVRKNARAFSLHFQCKPTVCLQKRSLGPDSAVIFKYVIYENMLQGQVTKIKKICLKHLYLQQITNLKEERWIGCTINFFFKWSKWLQCNNVNFQPLFCRKSGGFLPLSNSNPPYTHIPRTGGPRFGPSAVIIALYFSFSSTCSKTY